jgi:hypothetical protein
MVMDRRDFLELAGIGIVFVSDLDRLADAAEKATGRKLIYQVISKGQINNLDLFY